MAAKALQQRRKEIYSMATVALKGKTFAESKKNVSLKERIAESFRTYFEEYGAEIACGMLALSGNTNAVHMYQMLRK